MTIPAVSILVYSMLLLLLVVVHANNVAIVKDDSCLVNHLMAPRPLTMPRIFRECFTHGCAFFEHFRVGVISNLFFEMRTHENDLKPSGTSGLIEEFETYALDKCPDSVVYKKCFLDTLYLANLTMANGTVVKTDYFRDDINLAVEILPEIAFCEADEETKEKFYEFLEKGGRECISNQKSFLDKISACAFGNHVMDVTRPSLTSIEFLLNIQKCVPPLMRLCGKNGLILESIFNDTIMPSLMTSFQNFVEAIANHSDEAESSTSATAPSLHILVVSSTVFFLHIL